MKSLLYSQEMVLARKAGRKKQTRRIINPQPRFMSDGPGLPGGWFWGAPGSGNPNSKNAGVYVEALSDEEMIKGLMDFCPWQVWDKVYIKEAYRREGEKVIYRADGGEGKWKSSLFMKEEESRIVEVVSDVFPQRLQDISADDAIAEGIELDDYKNYLGGPPFEYAVDSFASLWDSIQGPRLRNSNPCGIKELCYVSYPWKETFEIGEHCGLKHYIIGNPWVWVIKFEI